MKPRIGSPCASCHQSTTSTNKADLRFATLHLTAIAFTPDLRLQDFMIDFMRSHPLDRISLTKGRSSTSKSHPAFNSILRRLSNPTKFSFFGDIRGQAEVRKLLVHIYIEKELPFLHFEVANEADARLRGEIPCRDK